MAMDQWIRDALAEEQGYTICPIRVGYIPCDKDCKNCKDVQEFIDEVNKEGS